jgi:hypothetical protein
MLKSLYRSAPESLLVRQLCPADAVPIQHLVVVHCHRHLDEPAGESSRNSASTKDGSIDKF